MTPAFRTLCRTDHRLACLYAVLWEVGLDDEKVTSAQVADRLGLTVDQFRTEFARLQARDLAWVSARNLVVLAESRLPTPRVEPPPGAGKTVVLWQNMTVDTEAQVEAQAIELHAYCNQVLGYDRKLTPTRKAKLMRRLAEFSLDELRAVVDWVATQPFLRGQNNRQRAYDDYTTMYRSRDRVEHYLEQARRGRGAATLRPSDAPPEVQVL